MTSSPLVNQSLELSIKVVKLYEYLCRQRKEFVMSKQILRSATSIGANIHEANFAVSRADFINKMQIALKETAETEYWLILLEATEYILEDHKNLQELCQSIKRLLIATLNTSKKKVKCE